MLMSIKEKIRKKFNLGHNGIYVFLGSEHQFVLFKNSYPYPNNEPKYGITAS